LTPDPRVRFSVVVPAFNEAAYLGRTLESLRAQDFPGGVEIIVVDNNSTDGTADISRSYGVVTLSEPRPGVCWARQRGTAAATGEIVVSTDADTVHPTDWLSRIDARFRAESGCVAVAGPCRFRPAPIWARLYPVGLFGLISLWFLTTGKVFYVSATNVAFRRRGFEGYDTSLTQGGDELDLLRRLRAKGRIVFDNANVVTTSARRLRRGLTYNVLVTLLFYYVLGYCVNRVVGRPLLPMAPPFRDERPRRSSFPVVVGLPVLLLCLVIWMV
jgi:glycosyltransferase involved in cell wall biosynthesis